MTTLATLVRTRRKALGLTRRAVAERGGPCAETIANIELARCTYARPFTIAKLERALDWWPGTIAAALAGKPPPSERQRHAAIERKARRFAQTDQPGAALCRGLLELLDEARGVA